MRKRLCRNERDLVKAIHGFQEKLTPQYCGRFINHLKKVITEYKRFLKFIKTGYQILITSYIIKWYHHKANAKHSEPPIHHV